MNYYSWQSIQNLLCHKKKEENFIDRRFFKSFLFFVGTWYGDVVIIIIKSKDDFYVAPAHLRKNVLSLLFSFFFSLCHIYIFLPLTFNIKLSCLSKPWFRQVKCRLFTFVKSMYTFLCTYTHIHTHTQRKQKKKS